MNKSELAKIVFDKRKTMKNNPVTVKFGNEFINIGALDVKDKKLIMYGYDKYSDKKLTYNDVHMFINYVLDRRKKVEGVKLVIEDYNDVNVIEEFDINSFVEGDNELYFSN